MQPAKKHKWVSLVGIPFVLLCGAAYSQQPSQLTAREILDRVISTYTSCRSYSDEGEAKITNVVRPVGGRSARFTTAFVRPGGFRFRMEASSSRAESVVWKDGDGEKFWTVGPGESEVPLDDGLARLAFFTGGASLSVPSLLFPDIFMGRTLVDSFDEPKLTGTEKIDGRQAFIIEGKTRGQIAKLWIDQSSFLILKTYRKARGPVLDEEVTTKYKPVVNIELAAEELTFKPPPGKTAPQPKASDPASSGPRAAATARLTLPDHRNSSPPRLGRFGESLRMNAAQIQRLRKKKDSSNEEDVIRVDTDLVVSEVEVLDRNGAPIVGLLAKDFTVREDGQAQEISSFSIGDASRVPRSIVLILDYSASQLPYIRTSVDAAKMLVDKLHPKDRMAIVSDDVKLLVDFTSDKEMLKANLELLRTKALAGKVGRSAQYDALIVTLRELFSEEDLRPIVIFQTDGDQLSLLKNETLDNPDPYLLLKNFGMDDLKTASERARATIYSIIPGVRFVGFSEAEQIKRAELDSENRQKSFAELAGRSNSSRAVFSQDQYRASAARWLRRQLALTDLAASTGGWAGYLEQPEKANEIYARVLSDINRRYVIGYYPTNKAKDGKRRTVIIEVRDHPEYVVSGRKAYYAPQPE